VQTAEPARPPDGQTDAVHQLGPGDLCGQVGNPRRIQQIEGKHRDESESDGKIPTAESGDRRVEIDCTHAPML